MEKSQQFLDKSPLNELLKLYKDKIDVGFVDVEFIIYVIESYLLRVSQLGLINYKEKENAYRQRKRRLQKIFPATWKTYWKDERTCMNEILRPYKHLENVKLKPAGVNISEIEKVFRPKKKGRPRKDNIFYTILILKGYFTLKLSKPNWPLIADILNLYCKRTNGRTYDYSSVESSWVDMKKNYIEKCHMRINEKEFSKWVYDQYLKSQEYGGNNG